MALPDRLQSRVAKQALAAWIAALMTVAGVAAVADDEPTGTAVRTDGGPDPIAVEDIPRLTLPDLTVPPIDVAPIEIPELPVLNGTLPPIEVPVTVPPVVEGLIEDIIGPDGAPVAVDREGLWLVDADRNHARLVVSDLYPTGASFAPDGTRAVVTTVEDTSRHGSLPVTMWVVDLLTGVRRQIQEPLAGISGVSWSPDGSWIAYSHPWTGNAPDPSAPDGPHGVGEVWIVRPDGSDAHPVAVTDGFGGKYAWSPDGSRFVANLANDDRVLIVDVRDGTEVRWPFDDPYLTDWSPDGSRLVVSGSHDGPTALMDPGSGSTQVLSADAGFARWSPSGTWIAVSDVNDDVALLAPDGTPGPTFSHGLPVNWSSDGSSLDFQNHTGEVRIVDVATGAERIAATTAAEPLSVSPTSWVPGTRWVGVVASSRAGHYTP